MKRTTFILFLLLSVMSLNAQENSWTYPVKAGSKEWKALKSFKERNASCQIPSDILTNLPTYELLKICMDYPYLQDIYFFNSFEEGYHKALKRFNGLQELVSRKDCALSLYNYLKNSQEDYTGFNILNSEERGKIINRQMIIESILSEKEIITEEDKSLKEKIAAEAYVNLRLKRTFSNTYGKYAITNAAFLLCSYLNELSEKVKNSPVLSSFLKTKHLDEDGKVINELIVISSLILK